MNYNQVQQIAKDTISYVRENLKPGISLRDVRKICEDKMLQLGADSFWYWDVGAFVFSGDETHLSVSGKQYETSDRLIESTDILTIDLSPQCDQVWGDYARTLILENGAVMELHEISRPDWKQGLLMEEFLHEELIRYARPDTTFEQLYRYMNDLIESRGFVNLDFAGNLGHSIVRQKPDRIYIEKGNHTALGEVQLFTFEPHISTPGSPFGYKKENIYYFDHGVLREL